MKEKDARPKPGTASKKHLLNFTLRGLPELEHFPDAESRQEALDQIGNDAGNPKSGQFWLAILLLAGAAWLARWLAGWLLSKVHWALLVEEVLHTGAMLAGGFVVLRWLHRSGTASELRSKLLARGVPICMKCGYLLRGLSPQTGKCPECGTQFSPRALELIVAEAGGSGTQLPKAE